MFLKAIYCLLRAIFPALKACCYQDANYPAMYKIYESAVDFDVVNLFGPIQFTEMSGIDLEMTKVYGEKLEFEL